MTANYEEMWKKLKTELETAINDEGFFAAILNETKGKTVLSHVLEAMALIEKDAGA